MHMHSPKKNTSIILELFIFYKYSKSSGKKFCIYLFI